MKILLIGEFSGVHNNLKKGLTKIGHDVKLAADGDGFKNFKYDFKISPHVGTFTGKIKNIIYIVWNLKRFTGYDVVQFISPFSIPYYYSFFLITFIIFRFNKKSVYYVCGTDPAFLASKDKFEYFPFDDSQDINLPKYHLFSLLHFQFFINLIDKIVPANYTYAVGYFNNTKLTKPIPLPGSGIIISKIRPVGEKIRILFGITRRGFKGAEHILKAIQLIESQFSNRFEFVIVEKLSFTEYELLLSECDVLIDQCKSYDYGMNAIIGMEHGMIVFSGSEEITSEFLGFTYNPIINIKPNANDIANNLIQLLCHNREELLRIKNMFQEHASNYHELRRVTNMFQNIY